MTKKHFVMLAATIKDFNTHEQTDPFTREQAGAIADFCQSQNAQFDRERFLSACGIAQSVPVRNGSFTVKHTTRDVWGVDDND